MSILTREKAVISPSVAAPERRRRLFSEFIGDPFSVNLADVNGTDREWLELAVKELQEGYEFLHFIMDTLPHRVTFFGSARSHMDPSVYASAERLGRQLAENDIAIVTGGGPGIMEAATRGAQRAGGTTVGFAVEIPTEPPSPFLTHSMRFQNLFVRQELLVRSGNAYVFYPGGFGTNYEFFHLLTLIQLAKVEHVPLIVVGETYWGELKQWIKTKLAEEHKTIDPKDFELFTVVKDDHEALNIIQKKLNQSVPAA